MRTNQIHIKQVILALIFSLVGLITYAQEGIGTNNPDASSALDVTSSDKGILIPRLTTAERDAIATPATGLIIYNMDIHCIEWYDGGTWQNNCSTVPLVTTLECGSATLSPATATESTAYTGTATVPYTGGNGGAYPAGSPINSTGVAGLTATLQAGTLNNGVGNLTLNITGTPASSGTANFNLSFGGQSCTFTLTVDALTPDVTTLDCATAILSPATATESTAYTGTATVPYTGGNGAGYAAGTPINSTGVTGLTATLQAGTLNNGAGNLTLNITGTPASSGTASFAFTFGGESCSFTLPVDVLTATVTTLDCASTVLAPATATESTAYTGTATVPYTGGNGGAYPAGSPINSTGVTGLTATLQAGTLNNGAGNLTLNITGTPASSGTANFNLSFGGQSCTFTLTVDALTPDVTTLDCATAILSPATATESTAYTGTATVPYTGGNGAGYAAGTPINSTGVTGLTATLQAGTLNNGAGNLTLNITGTPASSGTASFAFTFGGESCSFTLPVDVLTATVTTLDCASTVLAPATATESTAYTGTATVPYTGGNGGAYPAGSPINSTGVTGLTATLQAGTLNNGAGNLTLNITGTPASSGTANFNLSFGGQSCTFTLTVDALTPDVTTLDCATAILLPATATESTAYTGTATVPYTGGNGAGYAAGTPINSTGVTGLTATLQAGTLNNGAGNLTLNITGTPASSGTASFAFTFGGESCSFTLPVDVLTATVTTLDCASTVLAPATATESTAYTGTATVPYTGGNGGAYPAGSPINSTGVTGLTATLQAGTLNNGAGNLTLNITGTPASSGTASFAFGFGGESCTFTLTVDALTPDVTTLDCATATLSPATATESTAYTGTATVPYTGGNGAGYAAGTPINSTGVTGLTATLQAGTLNNGAGNLTLNITGTPASSGTASFAFTFGGESCSFTLPVDVLTATVTTLDCASTVLAPATATESTAYTGTATVPYTGGNGAGYAAGSPINSTGVTGLTATLQAGTLNNGAGNLILNITGTPASSGTASFAFGFGGQSCTFTLTVDALTPDVTTLDCASATLSPATATESTAYTGTATVPYTGGNGAGYAAGTPINSTGVTGLTATLQAGTLNNGAGNLTLDVTGTPASSGTASFALNFGGESCTFTLTVDVLTPDVTTLDCASATLSPATATESTAYTGTATVPYTGGNGAGYAAGTPINSTGVTGLTATLQAGTLNNGAGNLTLNITGTPASSGTASFALNFGGESCTFTLTVDVLTPDVTTLDCASATLSPATATENTAYTGTATVPYTGGNGAGYAAGTPINSTGVTGLTATLQAGTLNNGAGNLTLSITGTPGSSGTASFALNFGGQSCNFTLTVDASNPTVTTLDCASATFPAGNATQGSAYTGTASVPYTGGNGSAYGAGTPINSTGVTGLTATLQAGTLNNGAGNVTLNITGTPTGNGIASFNFSFGGQTCTVQLPVNATFVRWGYIGVVSFGEQSNYAFFNAQANDDANYGPTGTYPTQSDDGIDYTYIDSGNDNQGNTGTGEIFSSTAAQLYEKYDVISTGALDYSATIAQKLIDYAELGGTLFLTRSAGNTGTQTIFQNYGGTYSETGVTGISRHWNTNASALNNGVFGNAANSTIGSTTIQVGSTGTFTGTLPAGATLLGTTADPNNRPGAFLFGPDNRILFMTLFRGIGIDGGAIDQPEEIWIHNQIANMLDRRGF